MKDNKRIYRRYRKMTEEEQKKKFGFSEMDLLKEGSCLMYPYNELFQHQILIAEDITIED